MDIDIQLLMYKSIFMYVAKDHVLHSRENISVHRCFLFSPLIGLEKKCEYVSINNRNRG